MVLSVILPNLIHIAGHEPGLQLIKSEEMQVVSGLGAKHLKQKRENNLCMPITIPVCRSGYPAGTITFSCTFYTGKGQCTTPIYSPTSNLILAVAEELCRQ